MIIDIKLLNHTGKNNYDSPSAELTYGVVSDSWEDGPLAIAIQGESDRIADETGKILGWLPSGTPYHFGNQINDRIIATEVTVSDPKVLDADKEYDLRITSTGMNLVRNGYRHALVQWTVKQRYAERPMEEETFTLKTSLDKEEKVTFWFDAQTGQPVVNSAGDFFLKQPEITVQQRIYTLTRKEQFNPVQKSEMYHQVVNADNWYGTAPGTVLMISILPEWDGSVWKVEYKFKYKAEGWGDKYLDEGTRQLIHPFKVISAGPGGVTVQDLKYKMKVPILNEEGTQVQESQKLNGYGEVPIKRDANGDPEFDRETFKLIKIENFPGVKFPLGNNFYWKYRALPFAPLELPNPYFPISKLKIKVPK